MRKATLILISFASLILFFSCLAGKKAAAWQEALTQYRSDVDAFVQSVNKLVEAVEKDDSTHLQTCFLESRLGYKKIEWLLAYYNPLTAKQINGPALAEVEPSDKATVIAPEGFQVIEPLLFPHTSTVGWNELHLLCRQLRSTAGRVQTLARDLETTDAHVLDALRLQVFRILALGISGFDSPLAKSSLAEAKVSLESIGGYLRLFVKNLNDKEEKQKEMDGLITGAVRYLQSSPSFDSFNRAAFITGHLNPLSARIVWLQKALNIPFFSEPRALRATASTLFDSAAFDPSFYVPDATAKPSADKVLLGKELFYDAVLSNGAGRSCASCHRPEKAFTDGLTKAIALGNRSSLKRNTPTLINAALQPALFYDIRVSFLEDQAAEVVRNKDEMHGDFGQAAKTLQADEHYAALFAKAFGRKNVSEYEIKNALASYLRSLVRFTTPFDRYMRGEANALTAQQILGFNLFMGKAKCGTCHFMPLFNGVNPPEFSEVDAEVIGVPATTDTVHAVADGDEGRYAVYKISLYRYAFKTPTLRNVALTAPYMHNGVYKTLEDVIEFYNRGGGAGLGLKEERQTLSTERLQLSKKEKEALLDFLNSLTDEEWRTL